MSSCKVHDFGLILKWHVSFFWKSGSDILWRLHKSSPVIGDLQVTGMVFKPSVKTTEMVTLSNQNKSCTHVKTVNIDVIEINCIDQHFDTVREDTHTDSKNV